MLRLSRVVSVALASAAVLAVTAVPASAAVVDPAPIGPKQFFTGLVNDQASQAIIEMGCFGPSFPGQMGHPLSGQTVKVLPATGSATGDVGFTGDAGTSIAVDFPTPLANPVGTPVVLTDYAVPAKIPTTLTLPCGGTGMVAFRPVPTSPTAQTAFVTVEFVGQP